MTISMTRPHATWLVVCEVTHSCSTWLIHVWHNPWYRVQMINAQQHPANAQVRCLNPTTRSRTTWSIHTWHGSFMCDMTQSCATWLIRVCHYSCVQSADDQRAATSQSAGHTLQSPPACCYCYSGRCEHVYKHIYIYTYMCIYMNLYTYTYIYIYMHMCTYIFIYIYIYMNLYIYIYIYTHIYIHLPIHTHTYMYPYMYTCIHVYTCSGEKKVTVFTCILALHNWSARACQPQESWAILFYRPSYPTRGYRHCAARNMWCSYTQKHTHAYANIDRQTCVWVCGYVSVWVCECVDMYRPCFVW